MKPIRLKKISIVVAIIIVSDLIFKTLIVSAFEPTQMKEIIPGFLSVGRIESFRGAFGIRYTPVVFTVVQILAQACGLLLAIRVYKRPMHWTFKLALTMIISGWIGNHVDWLLFNWGNPGYIFTDYVWFHFFSPVISLTEIMLTGGWILLLFSGVVFFKDLKLIFQKPVANNTIEA